MKDIPQIPDAVSPDLRKSLVRMREELQALLGLRPGAEGAALRVTSSGTSSGSGSGSGGSGGGGGGGGAYVPDLTPPPTPTFTTGDVASGFAQVLISWAGITYTEGHGHKQTNIYAVKRDPASVAPLPTFGSAVLVATAPDALTLLSLVSELNTQWHVWLKFESVDGVESVAPAGGTNGVQATTGKIGNVDLGPLIVQAGNLAAGAVDATKFVSTIEPVTIVLGTLPTVLSTRTIFLASDGKLYRWNGTAYVATLATTDLTGTIADAQIAAIAAAKITGTLTDAQIADLAAAKLTGTIVETQIANDAITTPKIFAGAITTAKIAADAVTANEIAANAITAAKINAGAVTAAKIAANTITAGQIAANTITAGQIAAATITTAEIAADAITAGQIAAGAITAGKIAANAIAVGSAAIQNGAIVNAMIANATIDSAKIASLSAAQLTVGDGTVGGNLKSTSFTAGSGSTPGNGWRLTPAGVLHASDVILYGTVYATAGVFAGSLSAATGSFAGTVQVGSSPTRTGTTMTGTGTVLNPDGTVAFGNSTKSVVFDGTDLTLNGVALAAATGTFAGNVTGSVGGVTSAALLADLATRLSREADSILSAVVSVDAVASPSGFRAGTLTWDASGARTGGSGVAMTPLGLVAYNGATPTFTLNASTGAATFAGSLSAATGSFAGSLSAATGTFAGSLSAATGTFAGALSAATGSFSGTLTVGTSPAVSGTTMTGTGGVINSSGTFALGNATTNISFNGTVLTLNGAIVNAANLNLAGSFTASVASAMTGTTTAGSPRTIGTKTVTVTGGTGTLRYAWSIRDQYNPVNSDVIYLANSGSATVSVKAYCSINAEFYATVDCRVTDDNGLVATADFNVTITVV